MCADGFYSFSRNCLIKSIKNVATAIGAYGLLILLSSAVSAQEFQSLQPGEAYATRFSGTVQSGGTAVINTGGTVGSIIDIRSPGQAPRGEHWWNEPQRHPVTAAKVGQVFGVALDDASPPNIYVTATSAFGLHRTGDNANWMDGMWGADGGPGTVYKLSAVNNYRPEVFATITLDGRENSGASLGNIAYDKWNKQLFVSDLETGNIHRLRLVDGSEVGRFDHGVQGRVNFRDAVTGTSSSLAAIAFNPATRAHIDDCAFGSFSNTPSCWNFADFRRRVWGLGLRRDEASGEVRLHYAVWGSQGFGHPNWAGAGDDALNSVWSVAIAAGGAFDAAAVRREFFLPAFFTSPADIFRAGSSHPVTDIAFPSQSNARLMIVAERGGVRNLGLDQQNPFATPHEARTLRYTLGETGIWQEDGRYDVGYYDRKTQGQPFIRANNSGGVAFGFGYGQSWEVDLTKPDQFLWATGHSLCSPEGMCFDSSANTNSDSSQVHGMQGTFADRFDELLPEVSTQPYPATGPATPPATPDRSAMIDMDINVTASGDGIEAELNRNDATKIGDVEIYQPRGGTAGAEGQPGDMPIIPPPPPPPADGFDLGIHKAGPAECERGGLCVYTITVTNHGPSAYTGPILVQDGPDAGTLFISASAGWICLPSEGVINCRHDPVTLNVGQSITLTLTVRLPDDIPEDFTANCVQIIWPMGDDATEDRINLWVEMNLQLLGYATGPVDGNIDPVSEAAIRQYQLDHGLVETGTVNDELREALYPGDLGVRGDLNPANDRMCIQVPIVDDLRFDLGLQKAGPAACLPGAPCFFDIVITNHGPGNIDGPLVINDVASALIGGGGGGAIPPGAIFVVTPGWVCGPVGPFLQCRRGAGLVSGASATLRIGVNVGLLMEGMEAQIRNCANIQWSAMAEAGDSNAANDRDCVTVPIHTGNRLDLGIRKTGPAECTPGGDCTFNIVITNHGPGNLLGPLVINDLASAINMGGGGGAPINPASIHVVTPGWACIGVGASRRCRREAGLASGASTTLQARIALAADFAHERVRNCVNLQWDAMAIAGDINDANDRDCALVPVQADIPPAQLVPELGINKTAPVECSRGGNCIFTMTVRNHGPGTFEGPLDIIDTLPAESVFVRSEPAGWTCSQPSPSTIACRREDVRLAPGGADSVQVMVHIPTEYPEDVYNNCSAIGWTDMAASGGMSADGNAANDLSCVPVPLARRAFDLRIQKTGPAIWENPPDGWIDYQIVVTNLGPEAYTGPIAVIDTLPPMRNVRVSLPWFCMGLLCTHPSTTLAPGASVTMTVGILPLSPASGRFENCASLNWEGMPASGDSNSGNDGPACVTTSVGLISAVDISINTASRGGCRIGAPCSIAITVRNNGPLPFVGRLGIDGSLSPVAPVRLIRPLNPGWICNPTGSDRYQCRHNPLHLAPKATQSFRLTVAIPANFAGNRITHSVNLVWVEGKPDSNAANDKASVVIPLRKVVVPPPARIVCTSGTLRNGMCYCPKGWKRTTTGRNAYRCVKPVVRVRCSGGSVRNAVCYCPKGWKRTTTGRNVYRCIKPVVRVRCSGGSVRNGRCYCPRGYTRRTIRSNVYRCVKPVVRVRCTGGAVKKGVCYCPRGYTRRSIGRNAYRCTKRVIRKCAKGYVLRKGQCYRIRTKRP